MQISSWKWRKKIVLRVVYNLYELIGMTFRSRRDDVPLCRDDVPLCRDDVPPPPSKATPSKGLRGTSSLNLSLTFFNPTDLWISNL